MPMLFERLLFKTLYRPRGGPFDAMRICRVAAWITLYGIKAGRLGLDILRFLLLAQCPTIIRVRWRSIEYIKVR